MHIELEFKKKNIVLALILFIVTIAMHFVVNISVFNAIMFPVAFFAAGSLKISLSEKLSWLWTTLLFAASALMTTFLIQYILLVSDLRGKISSEKFFLNICLALVVYLFVQLFSGNAARNCIISHCLLLAFGFVNYFVYSFRENEFTFADIKAISTGMSVASNYQFSVDAQAVNALLLTLVYITFMSRIHVKFKKMLYVRLIAAGLIVISVLYVLNQAEMTVTETWEQKGSYRNGYLLNFVLSFRDSFVEKPEGYSLDVIAELEETYGSTLESGGTVNKSHAAENTAGKKPTIITIMNESFADLGIIGNLVTNQEVTPFINGLSENTIKGYALASVFGAKTPNSEWEYMTGNSMAFLPSGSVAFQQYVEDYNADSIVSHLQSEDYNCIAMHPYYDTGWSRHLVYPLLGFDSSHFLDDFDQSNLMRKYVSDATMFDRVIEQYEAKSEDENLFIMGVTMQNHGGYTDYYPDFSTDVRSINAGYSDVNQYLSLIHQTDLAVEKLITYFESVDEPVLICFFGDHQPSLNSSFYRQLNGKGLSGLTTEELEDLYKVPFFIWTNYESESREVECTSLNYLSTMVLEQAGIELPAYNRFLADMMEAIPSMNARAYYSNSRDTYLHLEDATAEEADWIQKYEILQYNNLFDKENQSQIFFGR